MRAMTMRTQGPDGRTHPSVLVVEDEPALPDSIHYSLEREGFDVDELFEVIKSKGRSLEVTEDRFWQGYGSDTVHLLFNLWYRQFGYTPAYENNFPISTVTGNEPEI